MLRFLPLVFSALCEAAGVGAAKKPHILFVGALLPLAPELVAPRAS